MGEEMIRELMEFLENSPTAFHAVENFKRILLKEGYQELRETRHWEILPEGRYFVVRNGSSIVAFQVGCSRKNYRFKVMASHSDFPAFKVKEQAELSLQDAYTKLNTEGYGGMLCATWMDRPLSVAGRAVIREKDGFRTRLVNIDRDLLLIPSVAIHMNRNANDGYAYNKQIDMLPLLGEKAGKEGLLKQMVAEKLHTKPEQIYGMDLYLYNRMKPAVWGRDREFLSSPRLDDLECAYASFRGFLEAQDEEAVNVFACFDNEEVGSHTLQGAGSTFLADVLCRINEGLSLSKESYYRGVAAGFMVSCDNAHAVHPNHPEKTDTNNCVYMNRGIVVKSHAGQQYTSDGFSIAVWKELCEKAGVPLQYFSNRSDMRGGSTLGNIAMSHVPLHAVDIGLAQLAMHSAYETAGVRDGRYLAQAAKTFYNSTCRWND